MSVNVNNTNKILEFLKNITPSTMSNDTLSSESYSASESFKIGGSKPVSNSNNKIFNEIKQLYHKAYGI
tara:strand:+ start:966 stop:1172 length:207 start_codon:yes stop_codon:yes gene_type:complete